MGKTGLEGRKRSRRAVQEELGTAGGWEGRARLTGKALDLPPFFLLSPLFRSPRQGVGARRISGPVKGQLVLQGQRGSCLQAEKLALCLMGSGSPFPLAWPD